MTIEVPAAPGTVRTFVGSTSQARIEEREATRALVRVTGMVAAEAAHALRFAAGTICPAVVRVVDEALARAEREAGLTAEQLRIVSFEVGPGEPVTRVRRLAHGRADWITTRTTAIRVELSTAFFPTRSDTP
ncbi:hypothetical protein PSU4_58820 [Pseudonocardia sulfidoxydans NBRC 16205]|uniref:50S ribosomal protein L22 n=1 Tax=Pseudonocardia sulfidoxydans NBRC 16205 TaxID=1223511 RepID=A0A511DV01_9PSEU|nr:uL22 family ribosomal protein [Pseudonocardia sulfidoxydans]GEL26928.1 hypothetical protein PSU4_58820 [Pseudonocardia sulfidoxydans NBRC 16205]